MADNEVREPREPKLWRDEGVVERFKRGLVDAPSLDEIERLLTPGTQATPQVTQSASHAGGHMSVEATYIPGPTFPAGPATFPVPTVTAPPEDRWAHRSEKMRCACCIYWVEKATPNAPLPANVLGRCRRHAPTLSGWPAVYASDWCGDHKLDEGKA